MKYVLGAVIGVILLLAVVGLFLPSTYSVERGQEIAAPAHVVFPYVAQLQRWPEWTVWTKDMDPTYVVEYSGPASGVGSTSSWRGDKMGTGSMTITEWVPESRMAFDLSFDDGTYVSQGAIELHPMADGNVHALWTNRGDVGMNIIGRYFVPFMDDMIGKDFAGGLTQLKTVAEADWAAEQERLAAAAAAAATAPTDLTPPTEAAK